MPFTEKLIKKCSNQKRGVEGLSDLVNTPFTFEYLSPEDALIVEDFLLGFFTEDNSLQKYLMTKFQLALLYHEDSMMNAVQALLLQDRIKERFTFEYKGELSEEILLDEISQYFANKGFANEDHIDENFDAISMMNSDKNEKVFVTVSCYDEVAILCTVSQMSC